MNDSVFGQYSLFCVFGSVVGCVVVPLIAQVLQQQSMECMILSAIVLSLTAAHLNKRCSSVTPHSKIVITKEYERKRVSTHSISSSRKTRSSTNTAVNNIGSSSENKNEKEYMQQVQQHQQHLEHLKIVEMEKRNELKRMKKLQKREERLKRKEEENRKKKELEDHYRSIKEKRLKQQKDKQYRHKYKTDSNTSTSSCYNYEKFQAKDWTNVVTQTLPKTYENVKNQNFHQKVEKSYQQKPSESPLVDSEIKNYNPNKKNGGGNCFAIKSSNRTASCSSLSSIGSSDSSSVSPSYTTKSSSWKPIWSSSTNNINSWFKPNNETVETLGCHSDRQSKSYSNTRLPHGNINFVSSSLFSGNMDSHHSKCENFNQENPSTVGEYTLFGGAHKLDGGSILTSSATF